MRILKHPRICSKALQKHEQISICKGNMGWLSEPVIAEEDGSVDELRESVRDLLDGNPALQVFASDACLRR